MMRHTNPLKSRGLAAMAAATLALGAIGVCSAPAWAAMIVQAQVTGQVTAVEGTTAVTINGTTYLIAPNSPAYQTVQSVNVGDTIGLILSGPVGVATSQVVSIVTGAAAGASSTGSSTSSAGGNTSPP